MLLGSCELDELRDQRRHLAELLDDVREQTAAILWWQRSVAREHLDVRAHARERRSQLVRRVRHELTLRARRFLQRTEHRVEARREPAQLVLALDVDPLGQVLCLRHPFDRGREPLDGSERGTRDEQPEDSGDDDAAERDEDEEQPDAVERLLDLGQGPGDLDSRIRAVREREHPQARAVDGDVLPECGVLLMRDTEDSVVDGQRDVLSRRDERAPIGSHELDVSARLAELGAQRQVGLAVR